MGVKMDEIKVSCSDCNKMFKFEESLVVHHSVCLKHQDNKSRRPFSCEQCGKSFKTMTSLRNHARTHTSYFDITKELYDQTLMSTFSSDNTSVLESTRTLEADLSVIDRYLDISAVTCSDSVPNTTNTSENETYTFEADKTVPCIAETTYTCDNGTTGTCIAKTTYTCGKETTGTCIAETTYTCDAGKTFTRTADAIATDIRRSTETDITLSKKSTNSSTTFTLAKQSGKTYVFTKAENDGGKDKEAVLGLAKTYIWDGEKRLSADRTYLVQNTVRNETIDTQEGTCDQLIDTPRGFIGHVTRSSRRQSGIPVALFSKKLDNDKLAKDSILVRNSPLRGIVASASVKSIRTLRDYRSKPDTPVNTKKSRNTPDRDARPMSRSRVQSRNQSSIRNITPNKERSKYAVRIAAHSTIDSPFRLTPLSPRFTPHGKRKNTPGGATFKCKKCGKAFNDKDQFDIHYVIHASDTPAKCGIPADCYKKNNRKLLFSTPDKKVNSVQKSTPSFACPHCQRCYQNERYLRSHMKIHFIDVPYPCSHCDKRFKYVQSLRAHAITHIGEESNKRSSSVRISWGNSDNMIEHVKDFATHLDRFEDDTAIIQMIEMPYTCCSCPFKTKQPTDLLKHMRIHSRTRPYKCTMCNKSYKTKSNLELHGKVHMLGKIRTLLSNRMNSVAQRT